MSADCVCCVVIRDPLIKFSNNATIIRPNARMPQHQPLHYTYYFRCYFPESGSVYKTIYRKTHDMQTKKYNFFKIAVTVKLGATQQLSHSVASGLPRRLCHGC